jgi:hypothetical protein
MLSIHPVPSLKVDKELQNKLVNADYLFLIDGLMIAYPELVRQCLLCVGFGIVGNSTLNSTSQIVRVTEALGLS